jgi:hypothetical protein
MSITHRIFMQNMVIMKRIPIHRDEFHRVRMLAKAGKFNRQLISNFNDLHR